MACRAGIAGYLAHFNEERPLGLLSATRPRGLLRITLQSVGCLSPPKPICSPPNEALGLSACWIPFRMSALKSHQSRRLMTAVTRTDGRCRKRRSNQHRGHLTGESDGIGRLQRQPIVEPQLRHDICGEEILAHVRQVDTVGRSNRLYFAVDVAAEFEIPLRV